MNLKIFTTKSIYSHSTRIIFVYSKDSTYNLVVDLKIFGLGRKFLTKIRFLKYKMAAMLFG